MDCEFDRLIEAGVPKVVHSDRGRLGQLLGTLLDNAVKFSERGEIVVTVGREKYAGQIQSRDGNSLPEPNDRLCFSVQDNGAGIPARKTAEYLRLFLPGRRLEHTKLRRHRIRFGDRQATGTLARRRDRRQRARPAKAPGSGFPYR